MYNLAIQTSSCRAFPSLYPHESQMASIRTLSASQSFLHLYHHCLFCGKMGYPKATASPVMIYKRQAEVDDGTLEDCEPDDTAVMYASHPQRFHS